MPRQRNVQPTYLHHKPTDQAYVRIPDGNGGRKTIYLGTHGSPDSKVEYRRVLAELDTAPSAVVVATRTDAPSTHDITVSEVYLAFWKHAQQHYRRADGTPTYELAQYRQTFALVIPLYGSAPAKEFGPLALKAVRQKFVDAGWARKLVNQRVGRVKRVFKWAASEELVPISVFQALATVTGLQAGRTAAKELAPVEPVSDEIVNATLPLLNRHVRGIVEFQRFTGCRPSEACTVRWCDMDRSGKVWLFKPPQHKTRHRGKVRVIAIGPRAQAVLKQFPTTDPEAYLFSSRVAVEELRATRTANRKTPLYPSHVRRNAQKRVPNPKRKPADRYTICAYEHALARACKKAKLARWAPNRLRHSFGTNVRKLHGLEAVQVALGHERADVTQVYAERNEALAVKIAAKIG